MAEFHSVLLRFSRCVADAAHLLSRPVNILPFALLALFEIVGTLAYVGFMVPPFSWFAPAWIARLMGPEYLHYPIHIWGLPAAFVTMRAATAVVVGFVFIGIGVAGLQRRLAERAGERGPGPRLTPRLLARFFLANAAWVLAGVLVHLVMENIETLRYAGRLHFVWVTADALSRPLVSVGAAASWILLRSESGVARSVWKGGQNVRAQIGPVFLVAVAATLLASPFWYLVTNAVNYVRAGHPGLPVLGAVAVVVLDVPIRCFLFGAALSLFGSEQET